VTGIISDFAETPTAVWYSALASGPAWSGVPGLPVAATPGRSAGRSSGEALQRSKELLTVHHILCHSQIVERYRSHHIRTFIRAACDFTYLINSKQAQFWRRAGKQSNSISPSPWVGLRGHKAQRITDYHRLGEVE
jgi:hypothetical protein